MGIGLAAGCCANGYDHIDHYIVMVTGWLVFPTVKFFFTPDNANEMNDRMSAFVGSYSLFSTIPDTERTKSTASLQPVALLKSIFPMLCCRCAFKRLQRRNKRSGSSE